METEKQSLTEALARYWSGVRYEDLPAPVIEWAKRVLLDTLSVGVRGCDSEAVKAVRRGGVRRLAPQEVGALEQGDVVVLLGVPDLLAAAEIRLLQGSGIRRRGERGTPR